MLIDISSYYFEVDDEVAKDVLYYISVAKSKFRRASITILGFSFAFIIKGITFKIPRCRVHSSLVVTLGSR